MAGDFVPVPDWFAWENQDCGLAVADFNGDGSPDLVVMMVDNPAGQNTGHYRVGSTVAADGTVASWGPWIAIPDWWGWENQGAGIAVADLDGSGQHRSGRFRGRRSTPTESAAQIVGSHRPFEARDSADRATPVP